MAHKSFEPFTVAGYKKKLEVPHEREKHDKPKICDALQKRIDIEPFLKRVITGNETGNLTDRGKGMVSRHKRSRSQAWRRKR